MKLSKALEAVKWNWAKFWKQLNEIEQSFGSSYLKQSKGLEAVKWKWAKVWKQLIETEQSFGSS
jgi:hypothetical protein